VAAGCGGGRAATTATAARAVRAAEDLSTWAGVRAELPLDPKLRHFAAFLLAPHPRPVQAEIERHRRLLDADPEGYLRAADERVDAAGAVRATSGAGATRSR
jgi:hypothetical protein